MKKTKKRISAAIKQIILILMTLVMFFPLYIVFVMGTYYSEDIFKGLPMLPSDYFLTNLKLVISKGFFSAYLNSITVSGLSKTDPADRSPHSMQSSDRNHTSENPDFPSSFCDYPGL